MNSTGWLVRRALLAIALMVGFYAFALAIAFGLLWIPYAEWEYVGRVHIKLAAVCLGGAAAVLWAIVPRADRFEEPGPRLDERRYPGLFRMIREVAAATRQEVPSDVYLVNEVNAWVTHRGGVMGFGSRRVMGVGLPLLQGLSQAELKAIIAHEFGHYASGDVKLGPWIYKTRAAIGRAIAGVHETWLEAPFQWYGRMFLRLSHAVSRRQEFIADRVATTVAGAAAAASALRQVTALSQSFSAYMTNELSPVLRAGFVPPIAAGFDQFTRDERTVEISRRILQEEEEHLEADECDTHPSLRERLSALAEPAHEAILHVPSGRAAELVADMEAEARLLLRFVAGEENFGRLKPIEWNAVGKSVYADGWRGAAQRFSKWLGAFTADSIPSGSSALIRAGSDLVGRDEQNVNSDDRISRALHVLGIGLAVALLDLGWEATTSPGQPIVLVKGAEQVNPFATVHDLASGRMPPDEWKARCLALGIAGRPLGAGAGAAAAQG